MPKNDADNGQSILEELERLCSGSTVRRTLLSPPSYTARAVRNDSVLLKALRSMKFWKREYNGGLLIDTDGLFHETAKGGGPKFAIKLRRGSKVGDRPLESSPGDRTYSLRSLDTRVCRTWSQ